jgi:hypothetical protein
LGVCWADPCDPSKAIAAVILVTHQKPLGALD